MQEGTKQRKQKIPKAEDMTADDQKPPQAQKKIDRVRYCETENIAGQAPARQKQVKKDNIQQRGKGIIAHGADLLGKTLEHSVGDCVGVEHQHHRRKQAQKAAGVRSVVNDHSKRIGADKKESCHSGGKQECHSQALIRKVYDSYALSGYAAA